MGEYIRFDNEHVGRVIDRQKRTTIRMGEPFVNVGDVVELKTARGQKFAKAEITSVEKTEAVEAADIDFDCHRKYHSWLHFAEEMNEYYGELIEPDTTFTVIGFEIINE